MKWNSLKSLRKLLPFLFGSLVGIFLWAILEVFLTSLKDADVKIVAAIIAAFGSLAAGVILAVINHSRTKARELLIQEKISQRELLVQKEIQKREIDESHREKKVEIYNDFILLVSNFMQASNPNNNKKAFPQQKVLNEVEKFHNGLLLWGSPDVIKTYLAYRKTVGTEGNHSSAIFISVDALYKAIREDIGLSNEGLDKYETMQMYLSDPAEIDELIKT